MRRQMMGLLGGFLALMLVFTFLSRAADSMTVPRVTAQAPERKQITHPVSGSGKVVQNREEAVRIQSGQLVKSIAVEEGSAVKEGDLLFEIDLEDVEDQIRIIKQELTKLSLQQKDAKSQKEDQERKQQVARARAEEDYQAATQQAEAAVSQALEELTRAQQELQKARESQKEAKQEEKKNKAAKDKEGKRASADAQTESGVAAPMEQLEAAVRECEAAYKEAVSSGEEAVRTARRSLEDAKEELADDSTAQIAGIDKKQKRQELKKLKKLVSQGGQVTAPVSGVVTGITLSVGQRTADGAAILLADESAGCKLVAQMPADQEEYIARNDPVTVTPSGSEEKIQDLKVDAVKVNEQDETLLDVTVNLPADTLEIGSSATAEVARESEPYSVCVPIQALYQGDQNQYYVLLAEEEETVLGGQLTAKRIDVTVLDKNSTYAALSEDSLGGDPQVIVTSDRVLEDGSRIRLEG